MLRPRHIYRVVAELRRRNWITRQEADRVCRWLDETRIWRGYRQWLRGW